MPLSMSKDDASPLNRFSPLGKKVSSTCRANAGPPKQLNMSQFYGDLRRNPSSHSMCSTESFRSSTTSPPTPRRTLYEPPVSEEQCNAFLRREGIAYSPNRDLLLWKQRKRSNGRTNRGKRFAGRNSAKNNKKEDFRCFPFYACIKHGKFNVKKRRSVPFHVAIMKKWAKLTTHLVEQVHEFNLRRTANQRISEAISVVKVANERKLARLSTAGSRKDNSFRSLVGDYGLALFSPLDEEAFEDLPTNNSLPIVDTTSSMEESCPVAELPDSGEKESETLESLVVELMTEPKHVLDSAPRILTPRMMNQIIEEGLPFSMQMMRWTRAYSLARDGDSFGAMLRLTASHKNTVVVALTSKGDILGGFADSHWSRKEGYEMGRSFYGSGQSFLFSTFPEKSEDTEKALNIFKWTGLNTYCQVCDVDEGQIAMGGGGAFGLIVQDNFTRGTTGRCSTFGNTPLAPDSVFEIVDFEVYGLLPFVL